MIRLRPFKRQDSEIIAGWLTDEKSFMKWCAGMYRFPMTAQQLCDRYDEFCRDDNAWFMTALDDSGRVCGHFIFRKAVNRLLFITKSSDRKNILLVLNLMLVPALNALTAPRLLKS